jgi:toxin ParE1/3/4
MKVRWTHESLDRLIEIEAFISKDSPERAGSFINSIIECGESIAENPHMGRMVPETANHSIRELIFKGYRIVYRLLTDRIEILTVFEGHRLFRIEELE